MEINEPVPEEPMQAQAMTLFHWICFFGIMSRFIFRFWCTICTCSRSLVQTVDRYSLPSKRCCQSQNFRAGSFVWVQPCRWLEQEYYSQAKTKSATSIPLEGSAYLYTQISVFQLFQVFVDWDWRNFSREAKCKMKMKPGLSLAALQ